MDPKLNHNGSVTPAAQTDASTATPGLLIFDIHGVIQNHNATAEELLGCDASQLRRKNIAELLPAIASNPAECTTTSPQSIEAVTGKSVEACITLLSDEEPELFAAVLLPCFSRSLNADITQNLHELKLDSIGRLAAGIAHEINTPTQYANDNTHFLQDAFEDINDLLVKIKKFVQQARHQKVTSTMIDDLEFALEQADIDFLIDEIPLAIEQTIDGLGRISKIVRAMKAFSHPGMTKKAPADINKAIESTVIVTKNEWKYAANLSCDFDPALHEVQCYEAELNQVILNLIINAVHAIQEANEKTGRKKGEIEITTRKKEDFAEIRIRDTGTGISAQVRDHIFEPFFTTKEVGVGTGQGLALAHAVIVNKHGGSLTFETEEGKGTTFIIRLPLYDSVESGSGKSEQARRVEETSGASTERPR